MNRLFTISLLLMFFGVGVLGFLAMGHSSDHKNDGCIGATAQGAACPEAGPLASAGFHSNAFRNFSQAVLTDTSTSSLLAFVAFVFLFGLVSAFYFSTSPLPLLHSRFNQFVESYTIPRRRISSWLSLLETSPTPL